MNAARLLRGAARVGSGLASLAALFVFVVAALADHTATASAAAGLCLALAVLAALDLESFEGLGIKAKLRTTLSDAEARLNGIDTIIRSLARSAFVQIAYTGMTDLGRKSAINELTVALQSAGVSSEAIETFKRPIYGYIASRLGYIAMLVRSNYISSRVQAIEARENIITHGPERDNLRIERERIIVSAVSEYPGFENFERFRAIITRMAAEAPVASPSHREILLAAMSEISDLFDQCLVAGNLTDQAMAAIGTHSSLTNPFAATLSARINQDEL